MSRTTAPHWRMGKTPVDRHHPSDEALKAPPTPAIRIAAPVPGRFSQSGPGLHPVVPKESQSDQTSRRFSQAPTAPPDTPDNPQAGFPRPTLHPVCEDVKMHETAQHLVGGGTPTGRTDRRCRPAGRSELIPLWHDDYPLGRDDEAFAIPIRVQSYLFQGRDRNSLFHDTIT